MEPYYQDESITIFSASCLNALPYLADCSVDSVVTDPPYELGFMGKSWDRSGIAYNVEVWKECLRVLKPGGHLLAFGGSRTYHRLACAIEDAGFEIRDQIQWIYGSGFPKSLDVSKAIDAAAGAERGVIGRAKGAASSQTHSLGVFAPSYDATAPATEEAKQWSGWGTALKPSHEPIIWARKPLTPVLIESKLVAETQHLIGSLLCQLLSSANSAEVILASSPSVSGEASASALLLAAVLRGPSLDGWCERMATCSSQETVSTCLSIASSWNDILDTLLNRGSRFTTETIIGLTTALKTLNSYLSEIMPASIIRDASLPVGELLNVEVAESNLSDGPKSLRLTQEHTARVLASLRQVLTSANGAEAGFTAAARVANSALRSAITHLEESLPPETRPAHEPIVLARKPLIGTVAENVLQHGTGGLNVDGCRIETVDVYSYPNGPGGKSHHYSSDKRSVEVRPNPAESNPLGRWPANVILSYPEDEYELCASVTAEQKKELFQWLYENA
jgi:hypothetical protein